MLREESYFETIDRIAKRDGLDLIMEELKARGHNPVMDQTGGFCLCVGVYGVKGWIWANIECVCFYTNEEDDEGELLLDNKEIDNHELWAKQCADAVDQHIKKIGVSVGVVKSLWAELQGMGNEQTLSNFYELREEIEHRTGKAETSRDFLVYLSNNNGWDLSNSVEFFEAINESAEMGRN